MKIDPKLGKTPFNCFTTHDAEKYIGKYGYFSNFLESFNNINDEHINFGVLTEINHELNTPFIMEREGGHRFFVPASTVRATDLKLDYRPYKNLYEFRSDFNVGDTISVKYKINGRTYAVMYLGDSFITNESNSEFNDIKVNLGGSWFYLNDLFNDFEVYEWSKTENRNVRRPFGVKIDA